MVIGVTGGVGSGKSTVLNFLRDGYRAQIIEEDQVARELMEPGEPAIRRSRKLSARRSWRRTDRLIGRSWRRLYFLMRQSGSS